MRLPALLACVLCCAAECAHAQHVPTAVSLPDAPGFAARIAPEPLQQPVQEATQEQAASASVSGIVEDANGALVPQAKVTLTGGDSRSPPRSAQSDSAGHFSLQGVPAGTYKLTVASPGLGSYSSPEFKVTAAQHRELAPILLGVATLNTDVDVTASVKQVAQAQVHAEEQQRFLGIVPNFYTSYIWDAARLDAHQKFVLAARSSFDPVTFLSIAAVAGIEQWRNTYPSYGPGPEGYGARYGSAFADEVSSHFFSYAVYPSLFHQDPRYFYKGVGTKTARAEYAITRVFVTRGNNGKTQPNYSLILGRLTAGGLSNLYHDPSDRGAAITFENAFLGLASHAADNLVREFVTKRFTTKVPPFEDGEASAKKP